MGQKQNIERQNKQLTSCLEEFNRNLENYLSENSQSAHDDIEKSFQKFCNLCQEIEDKQFLQTTIQKFIIHEGVQKNLTAYFNQTGNYEYKEKLLAFLPETFSVISEYIEQPAQNDEYQDTTSQELSKGLLYFEPTTDITEPTIVVLGGDGTVSSKETTGYLKKISNLFKQNNAKQPRLLGVTYYWKKEFEPARARELLFQESCQDFDNYATREKGENRQRTFKSYIEWVLKNNATENTVKDFFLTYLTKSNTSFDPNSGSEIAEIRQNIQDFLLMNIENSSIRDFLKEINETGQLKKTILADTLIQKLRLNNADELQNHIKNGYLEKITLQDMFPELSKIPTGVADIQESAKKTIPIFLNYLQEEIVRREEIISTLKEEINMRHNRILKQLKSVRTGKEQLKFEEKFKQIRKLQQAVNQTQKEIKKLESFLETHQDKEKIQAFWQSLQTETHDSIRNNLQKENNTDIQRKNLYKNLVELLTNAQLNSKWVHLLFLEQITTQDAIDFFKKHKKEKGVKAFLKKVGAHSVTVNKEKISNQIDSILENASNMSIRNFFLKNIEQDHVKEFLKEILKKHKIGDKLLLIDESFARDTITPELLEKQFTKVHEYFHPNYIQDIFKKLILPRLENPNGKKYSLEKACDNIKNLKIVAHCHGSHVFMYLEKMMQQKMQELGYSPQERQQIQKQLTCLTQAPYCPLGASKSQFVSFMTKTDPIIRHYNYLAEGLSIVTEITKVKEQLDLRNRKSELLYLANTEYGHTFIAPALDSSNDHNFYTSFDVQKSRISNSDGQKMINIFSECLLTIFDEDEKSFLTQLLAYNSNQEEQYPPNKQFNLLKHIIQEPKKLGEIISKAISKHQQAEEAFRNTFQNDACYTETSPANRLTNAYKCIWRIAQTCSR